MSAALAHDAKDGLRLSSALCCFEGVVRRLKLLFQLENLPQVMMCQSHEVTLRLIASEFDGIPGGFLRIVESIQRHVRGHYMGEDGRNLLVISRQFSQ